MDELSEIEAAVKTELSQEGLYDRVIWSESRFVFLGDLFAQLVVGDAGDLSAVKSTAQRVSDLFASKGLSFQFEVRAIWELVGAGEAQPLYSQDGGLMAATIVPVRLRAGRVDATPHVIITWSADRAIRQLVPHADLRQAALALVRSKLADRSIGAWSPQDEPILEINAAAAPFISGLLKRAA